MTQSTLPPIHVSQLDLDKLNRQFKKAYPKEILAWCGVNLPSGLVQTSAFFNIDDMVITDLLYRELRPTSCIPILFLDTLHHFQETLDFVSYSRELYKLNLQTYRPLNVKTRKGFAAKYGQKLWEKDPQKYDRLTKSEPLERGLKELGAIAWINGQRRKESCDSSTTTLPIFEYDVQGRLQINPLVNWSRTESWAYTYEHDMIYHPLHDLGYSVIGDEPLTPQEQREPAFLPH
ncbi:MAG: phosphoadenosine phosphosulfate reductase family protein [Jaaginema sp. PMC 1079.18]|nr:phosphoadenosine phosphosulfate reductase family protein [Jaaginema sp. PMC 1080.18]MEC4851896.1 phosphoadenosine phosphosulfate reductase family protein [Jaaginema sp. PMC 1079.18]MEC4865222.1 phosphoadenosine phosphosulfate reductase family protein [Jaaginema sp. PMC 1078.18]